MPRLTTPVETIERARALWDSGLSAADVAAEMGLTKNQVCGIAHRNGFATRTSPVRAPELTPGQRADAARLLRAGQLTMPAIATQVGCTLEQVRRVAMKLRADAAGAGPVRVAATLGGELRAQQLREQARRAQAPRPPAAFARPVGSPSKTCMWPAWGDWKKPQRDPRGPLPLESIRFCGEPSQPGTSYCPACLARAYAYRRAA